MYRNNYTTQQNFHQAHNPTQSQFRHTSTTGFGHRAPLYPIGPTLTQPQFRPMQMQRGFSPSPYLAREGMKPPSYENKYLSRAEGLAGQINLSYEERERRLIEKNQRQIEQQQKRRQQIRASYQRQLKTLTTKLSQNLTKKTSLHTQIQSLTQSHQSLSQKLLSLTPPQPPQTNLQHIDRKQQQMIILKNKLMNTMRENQVELNRKYEEEERYWEEQLGDKEKFLFGVQQRLRDIRGRGGVGDRERGIGGIGGRDRDRDRVGDLAAVQEEIRNAKFEQFMEQYQQLQRRIKYLTQQRQHLSKTIQNTLTLKTPQIHNTNLHHEQLSRQQTNLQLRIKQLQRVSVQMQAANQNLQKQLQRKQTMIAKYEEDIHDLKQKKEAVQGDIGDMMGEGRSRGGVGKGLGDDIGRVNQRVRVEQAKGARLKSGYQKLYQLLCSATSRNIHQVFGEAVVS